MHQHFDVNDVQTGYTVVTRESMWDDSARERALELQRFEDALCKCGCGLPMVDAHTDQPFKVETFVDYAARAIERAKPVIKREAERVAKDQGGHLPDDWDVGRHYYAVVPDPSELREDRRGH